MARFIKFIFLLVVISIGMGAASAQTTLELVAPNIFVRGIQLPQGVRYTVAFVKPEETAALKNISVEITLPADAEFAEMLVSRQVQFHVVRRNSQRQLTLIWQLSRLAGDQALDAFSFMLAQPLSAELEVYMQWQTEAGEQRIENFFELPPVMNASQTEAQVTTRQIGFTTLGDTGVQVFAPVGSTLIVKILPQSFNPPPEYGALWWCSLLELNGLAPDTTAKVIVPLRRTLAPFTALTLFQQRADGSWAVMTEQGMVTADGQYVIYTHPGGVVATGGSADIQPAALPAAEIPIVEGVTIEPIVPPPAPVTDGTSNTIVAGEVPPASPATDGTSNTIVAGEVPPAGDGAVVPIVPPPAPVTDGTSNTIVAGEVPPAGDGAVAPIVPPSAPVTDGTSNTIVVGEVPPAGDGTVATIAPHTSQITDGTSNTIVAGEVPPAGDGAVAPIVPPPAPVTDGTSNTIVVGEVPPAGDGTVATIAPHTSQITDGTSNTIVAGEVPPAGDGAVVPIVPPPAPVTDGTSNTIVIGGAPVTNGVVIINAPPPTTIADGSSNTIIVVEATITPVIKPITATPQPPSVVTGKAPVTATPITKPATAIPQPVNATAVPISTALIVATVVPTKSAPVFSAVVTGVIVQPFGAGGTRVEIVALNSTLLQCQFGQVNCTALKRRQGAQIR